MSYQNRKVILVVPVFANSDLFDESREFIKPYLTPGLIDECVVLGNKYPLPTVKDNDDRLKTYCIKHGYTYFDSEYDRGLHESLNNYFIKNPQPEGTIFLCFDSDSKTKDKGFDLALVKVIAHTNSKVAALWNVGMDVNSSKRWDLSKYTEVVEGLNIIRHPTVEMFNITVWDINFIMGIGGFKQPFKYYGGIEVWIYQQIGKQYPIRYLKDFKEVYEPFNHSNSPLYREWKDAHLAGCTHDFATWLKVVKGIDT